MHPLCYLRNVVTRKKRLCKNGPTRGLARVLQHSYLWMLLKGQEQVGQGWLNPDPITDRAGEGGKEGSAGDLWTRRLMEDCTPSPREGGARWAMIVSCHLYQLSPVQDHHTTALGKPTLPPVNTFFQASWWLLQIFTMLNLHPNPPLLFHWKHDLLLH